MTADVRECFGFGKSFGDHGMGLKRKTGEELRPHERVRQRTVLDKTSSAIAKIKRGSTVIAASDIFK